MYICRHCGKEVYEPFGSGKFCSRACANSRTFSDEAKQKKRDAVVNTRAYSNSEKVIYLKCNDTVPEGFVEGNFLISKNFKSLQEFESRKNRKPRNRSVDYYRKLCTETIKKHNDKILLEYTSFLKRKAEGKIFIAPGKPLVYSQYYAYYCPKHSRQHQGYVFAHILMAEVLLNRPLTSTEIVHHIDEDKLHNSFDNFYIFDNKSSHSRFHNSTCYWLSIEKDVLKCSNLTKEQLMNLLSNHSLNS